jgi:hypothetical protein
MLTRIYHKKDEQFNIEFFQDENCRQAFNFENVKNLYIELKEGDCTPIFKLSNKLWSLSIRAKIFTPIWYLGFYGGISPQTPLITLQDLENIFSKYIPEDNAILFLSKDEADKYAHKCEAWFLYQENLPPTKELNSQMDIKDYKKITIFIESYTESEIKKTIDIAKKLKEEYGLEEVNVFALHCFANLYGGADYINLTAFIDKGNGSPVHLFFKEFVNKIIITNSTCGSKTQNKKRRQIIDCYNIFNDWLKRE